MDAAFGFLAVGPAARACIVAWIRPARAGHAAERCEALARQRMARQVPGLEHLHDFGRRDARQRIELQGRAFDFHRGDAGALAALIALTSVDPGIEIAKSFAERLDLAQ